MSDDVTGFLVTVVRKREVSGAPGYIYLSDQPDEGVKKIGIAQVDSAMELSPQWKKKIEETLLVTTRYETMEITYRVDKKPPGWYGDPAWRPGGGQQSEA